MLSKTQPPPSDLIIYIQLHLLSRLTIHNTVWAGHTNLPTLNNCLSIRLCEHRLNQDLRYSIAPLLHMKHNQLSVSKVDSHARLSVSGSGTGVAMTEGTKRESRIHWNCVMIWMMMIDSWSNWVRLIWLTMTVRKSSDCRWRTQRKVKDITWFILCLRSQKDS